MQKWISIFQSRFYKRGSLQCCFLFFFNAHNPQRWCIICTMASASSNLQTIQVSDVFIDSKCIPKAVWASIGDDVSLTPVAVVDDDSKENVAQAGLHFQKKKADRGYHGSILLEPVFSAGIHKWRMRILNKKLSDAFG